MADYIVKDTELTSVANAIRTAGGTSSLLNFPNGFVSVVNNISGGGGSSDFHKVTITFEVSTPTFGETYTPWLYTTDGELVGCVISDGAIITEDVEGVYVLSPNVATLEVEILKDKYIMVRTEHSDEVFTISGDAELFSTEGFNFVKVFGDCTISTVGSR